MIARVRFPNLRADSIRPHYGERRVRASAHQARAGVRCLSFENFTLAEIVEHLETQKTSGGVQDFLSRYDIEHAFPDLSLFRLGPNTFGETALDWILFITAPQRGRDAELIAHGVTTRIRWDGDPANLPRGWTGAVRQSYEESVLRSEEPNTLIGLFIFAEPAFREHGWAAEVALEMKRIACEGALHSLIIPLRLPTRYEPPNAVLPYEEFALQKRDDGEYCDHWLRMHTRLGAEIIGLSNVSHQHAMHPDDLRRLFRCGPIAQTGEHLVEMNGEHYYAFVDLEREYAVINQGCVWVRHPIVQSGASP